MRGRTLLDQKVRRVSEPSGVTVKFAGRRLGPPPVAREHIHAARMNVKDAAAKMPTASPITPSDSLRLRTGPNIQL
jgi:hypothetical protein